jgi:hypothetical protein
VLYVEDEDMISFVVNSDASEQIVCDVFEDTGKMVVIHPIRHDGVFTLDEMMLGINMKYRLFPLFEARALIEALGLLLKFRAQ